MKVAYITMQFPVPSETFASWDVESLRKQGCEVSVYCMRPKSPAFGELVRERGHSDIAISHFSWASLGGGLTYSFRHPLVVINLLGWVVSCCFRSPKHLFKSLVLFPSVISIFRSLFEKKPDVVHLFWGHYPAMVGYLVDKYMPGTVLSMFLGAHDLISAYPGSVKLSRNVNAIFTHSRANLEALSAMGIDVAKVHVVARGIKLDFPVLSSVKKFYDLQNPVFLAAGRLIEDKGFDDVLRVFKNILRAHPSAVLKIAGDGPFRSRLVCMTGELKIERSVCFLGHLDQLSLVTLMSEAHFFLLMSRHPSERLPNVVKEAMFQKCIVLTTKTPGVDELVESGVTGYIVEKGDCNSASQYVLSCLQKTECLVAMACAANSFVGKGFNVDVSMARYIDYWRAGE